LSFDSEKACEIVSKYCNELNMARLWLAKKGKDKLPKFTVERAGVKYQVKLEIAAQGVPKVSKNGLVYTYKENFIPKNEVDFLDPDYLITLDYDSYNQVNFKRTDPQYDRLYKFIQEELAPILNMEVGTSFRPLKSMHNIRLYFDSKKKVAVCYLTEIASDVFMNMAN
jgi:hypothetical protein